MNSYTNDLRPVKQALQKEFIRRCRKNTSYSLRAYAKFLGVDQSLLSKIMKGDRKISRSMAATIGPKLGLNPSQTVPPPARRHSDYLQLEDDEFSVISDWIHFAILELVKIQKRDLTPTIISRRLGIHVEEARAALDRLNRVGLVRSDSRGNLAINSGANSWSNNQYQTEGRRLLQRSLLEKSLTAIDTEPFERRDHGSLTIAIDRNRVPEFKERLRQIRQELGQYFQSTGELNEVYQLTTSFFPLTKEEAVNE